MRFQRSFDNQNAQRMIKSGSIMAKFRIDNQNDPSEREADQVSNSVMQMPEAEVQPQAKPEEEVLQP